MNYVSSFSLGQVAVFGLSRIAVYTDTILNQKIFQSFLGFLTGPFGELPFLGFLPIWSLFGFA